MRKMNLTRMSFVLVVAAGMVGVRPALASSVTPADLVVAIEESQAALEDASVQTALVEEQLVKLRATVTKLEESLKAAAENLIITENDLGGIAGNVDSIRGTFGKNTDISTGQANLHPMNESGVKAKIDFVDDGTTLMVNGSATGLDPAESYFSNIYDNSSVPGGPNACIPTIFDPEDPDFILPTMFLGFWAVDEQGNGTLSAINTNGGADFVPLDKIGTVSIRLFIAPPPAPGAPPVTELVACGRVATRAGN